MFGHLINIHKNFILKPNPYVTQEEAEDAYIKFAVGEFMILSALGCFSLSLFKFIPQLSQRAIFKKFTVVQALTSVASYAWYFYELNRIGNTIPVEQLDRQKHAAVKIKSAEETK